MYRIKPVSEERDLTRQIDSTKSLLFFDICKIENIAAIKQISSRARVHCIHTLV
jgi:hypothetical protein